MKTQSKHRVILISGLLMISLLAVLIALGPSSQAQVPSFAIGQQVTSNLDLNIRSGPQRSYPSVGVLIHGQPATITGAATYGWYPVSYAGINGWASGDFLQLYRGAPSSTGVAPSPTVTSSLGNGPDSRATLVPTVLANQTPITTPQPSITPVVTATLPFSAAGFPTKSSQLPTVAASQGVMLAVMSKAGSIRAAPNFTSTVITSWWVGRKLMIYDTVQGAAVNGTRTWYVVGKPPDRERMYYVHSSLVRIIGPVQVIAPQYRLTGHWIDVNLSQQTLTAFDGQTEVMHTLISSGTAKHPTDIGVWRIYWRLTSQTMENRAADKFSPDYYRLPGVPYPQYFNPVGDAIHGTYWHDNFGTPMSHGCVNATTPAATWLYQNFTNLGTPVVIHY